MNIDYNKVVKLNLFLWLRYLLKLNAFYPGIKLRGNETFDELREIAKRIEGGKKWKNYFMHYILHYIL